MSSGHRSPEYHVPPLATQNNPHSPDSDEVAFETIPLGDSERQRTRTTTTPQLPRAPSRVHLHPPRSTSSSSRSQFQFPSRNRPLLSSFRTNPCLAPPATTTTNYPRSSASRLWNPINYVPRAVITTPRPPHFSDENLPLGGNVSRDAYPLLTIPEQRRSRLNPSPNSLAVERSVEDAESARTSVGLPANWRRSGQWGEEQRRRSGNGERMAAATGNNNNNNHRNPNRLDDGIYHPPRHAQSNQSLRASTHASVPSSQQLQQQQSNGGGDNGDVAEELAWGPSHPCYPHLNPHVPLQSEEFTSTRIIRIRRDWMVEGDLAPTFSNLYPEILDPLLPEQEFRRIIAKINSELTKAFDPFSLRNWVDSALGLLTGWLWDDFGGPRIKSHLQRIEDWLEKWNREVGAKEGVHIWSLRRTAYMTLDIQIPDPKIGIVEPEQGTRPNSGAATNGHGPENHER